MSHVYQLYPLDQLPGQVSALNGHNWFGFIATNPVDFIDKLYVILPDFSPELQFGPARWQSRDASTLPKRGDKCLVQFDNLRQAWVTAWWPIEYDDITPP